MDKWLNEKDFIEILRAERPDYIKSTPIGYPSGGPNSKVIIIENLYIQYINTISSELIISLPVIIRNCHFAFYFSFSVKGVHNSEYIIIENCQFLDFFKIENIKLNSLQITECKISFPASISNLSVESFSMIGSFGDVQLLNNNINSTRFKGNFKVLYFGENSLNRIFLESINSDLIKIDSECSFNSDIIFKDSPLIKKVELNQLVEYKGDIIFKDNNIDELVIYGGKFKKDFIIESGDFNQIVSIKNGEFDEKFEINGGNFKEKVEFIGGSFTNNISISQAKINYLNIDNIEKISRFFTHKEVYINRFSFTATKGIFNLFINETSFNQVEFLRSILSKDSFFQVNQAKIQELTFDRFSNFGNIHFTNIEVLELSRLNFANITTDEPKIKLINSDLGKTTIIDCNLTGYTFEFQSSKMSEMFLVGTRMPHSVNIKSIDNEQKRLALSQIKKVYENRGDSLTANEYYAEEMKTYYKQLWQEFNIKKIPEILNLSLNWISNNFGQSWFLALILALTVIFISLELLTYSLGFSATNNIIYAIKWKLGLIFDFIHPTTKLNDFIKNLTGELPSNISWLTKFIFGFSRFVVIPFFIYQLIAAFRKYGKKM
ncbi:MAG: hypothetical protein ACK4NY_06960 [Spirosomataceae bacterium]